jgi:hypothetical protein
MCLSKVTTTYDKPSDLIVDGWKEFSGKGNSLSFSAMGGTVALDVWLQASASTAKDLTATDGKKYKVGFHIYAGDVFERYSSYRYRRVYLRRITCIGDQDGKKCVIAQELYVPSDPDAWPP